MSGFGVGQWSPSQGLRNEILKNLKTLCSKASSKDLVLLVKSDTLNIHMQNRKSEGKAIVTIDMSAWKEAERYRLTEYNFIYLNSEFLSGENEARISDLIKDFSKTRFEASRHIPICQAVSDIILGCAQILNIDEDSITPIQSILQEELGKNSKIRVRKSFDEDLTVTHQKTLSSLSIRKDKKKIKLCGHVQDTTISFDCMDMPTNDLSKFLGEQIEELHQMFPHVTAVVRAIHLRPNSCKFPIWVPVI